MNLKQLSILIVLVALLGGLGSYLYKADQAKRYAPQTSASGQKLLGEFPLNDVAQITLKTHQGEVNLAKSDDLWKVKERNQYPANYGEIHDLLRKMWELKGVQEVKVGQTQLGRVELQTPDKGTNSGTLVEFKDKSGKLLKSVLLGKKHMRQSEGAPGPMGDSGGWPNGRFILVQGEATPKVWIISEAFSNLEPKADSWLSKDFFKVEKLRSASVTTTNATNNWKLFRETEGGELKLADKKAGEELDSSKASGVGSLLSWPSFTDVLPPDAKPETTGMDKPVEAVLDTFENFTYTVKVGKYTNDENFALQVKVTANIPADRPPGKDEKKEDKEKLDKEFKEKNDKLKEKLKQEQACEKWTYVVSKWTVDQVLKPRSEFIAAPSTNAPAAALTPGPVTSGPVTIPPAVPGIPAEIKLDTNVPPVAVPPAPAPAVKPAEIKPATNAPAPAAEVKKVEAKPETNSAPAPAAKPAEAKPAASAAVPAAEVKKVEAKPETNAVPAAPKPVEAKPAASTNSAPPAVPAKADDKEKSSPK